jgi:hypothetical protein
LNASLSVIVLWTPIGQAPRLVQLQLRTAEVEATGRNATSARSGFPIRGQDKMARLRLLTPGRPLTQGGENGIGEFKQC